MKNCWKKRFRFVEEAFSLFSCGLSKPAGVRVGERALAQRKRQESSSAIWLLLILLVGLPLAGFGSEAAELFEQAKTVAKSEPLKARKLFQLSGLKFEALAEAQPQYEAEALYNAGNAYFFAEEQGRALYAWRRAEQRMPFNRELKANIAYLLELGGEEGAVTAEASVFQKIRAVFPVRIRVALVMIFFLATVVVAASWQWRAKGHRVLFTVLAGLAVLFGLSLLVRSLSGPRNGVVLSFQAEARKGDGYIYEPAFAEPLGEATEFRVRKTRGDWVLAKLPDGNEGWLPVSEIGLW